MSVTTTASPLAKGAGVSGEGKAALDTLLDHGLAWATANGLQMVVKDPDGLFTSTHLPFSLLPNTLPEASFEQAQELAPLFNTLVDRISRDGDWLQKVLGDVLAGDPFTAELVRIHASIEAEGGPRQPLCLGIHRSDYMLHAPADGRTKPHLLQVELNTIASSFGCMSALTGKMHRHLLGRFMSDEPGRGVGAALREHIAANGVDAAAAGGPGAEVASRIPENPTLARLPAAMAEAHKSYGKEGAVVVFVVQPGESNAVDQRLLEFALWETHSVRVMRLSLGEIAERGKLSDDGRLLLDGETEVAVVYFRAGYTPDDYKGQGDWDARLMVERALAIKCPSIAYHLAGTKKVQQVLAAPGQVERFLSPADSARVRRCFAGLHSVGVSTSTQGGSDTDKKAAAAAAAATREALARPAGFVLKPQREGGGNNLFGADLARKLTEASAEELRAYILMQRIFPRTQQSVLVNRGRVAAGPSVSEWGFYGTYLGRGGDAEPLLNEYAGYLVRTKLEGVDEGGVASGYAMLSSAVLAAKGEADGLPTPAP